MVCRIIANFTVFVNFVIFVTFDFVSGLVNYRKFRSFRKFRNFRNSRNFRRAFSATFCITSVDFVNGLANYRKFSSFRKFCHFRNSRNFWQGFPATLWRNYIDFVNGLANYRKFRSFCSCVQSWTLLTIERQAWTREWIKRREELGAYHTLFWELAAEDTIGFGEYMRMPHAKFLELVEVVGQSKRPMWGHLLRQTKDLPSVSDT